MTNKMTPQRVEEAVAAARAKGHRPDFCGADLSGLDLTYMDLHHADFRDADLRGATMHGVNLSGSDMTGARMPRADLRRANMREAKLCYANLRGAYLYRANMRAANLRGANLLQADLYRADLRNADLFSANLSCADLTYAILTSANVVGLFLEGLPSGHLFFVPTTKGWQLSIGCWLGTTNELRDMIAKDDGWPGAIGDEITERRPMLEAAADMCDSYANANPNAVSDVKAAAERRKENR